MTQRSRLFPRPPAPMRATLMRSLAPRMRAWAGAACPTTPRATPAPTAVLTNSRRPSFGGSIRSSSRLIRSGRILCWTDGGDDSIPRATGLVAHGVGRAPDGAVLGPESARDRIGVERPLCHAQVYQGAGPSPVHEVVHLLVAKADRGQRGHDLLAVRDLLVEVDLEETGAGLRQEVGAGEQVPAEVGDPWAEVLEHARRAQSSERALHDLDVEVAPPEPHVDRAGQDGPAQMAYVTLGDPVVRRLLEPEVHEESSQRRAV